MLWFDLSLDWLPRPLNVTIQRRDEMTADAAFYWPRGAVGAGLSVRQQLFRNPPHAARFTGHEVYDLFMNDDVEVRVGGIEMNPRDPPHLLGAKFSCHFTHCLARHIAKLLFALISGLP